MTKLSVIVLNYNTKEVTKNCLNSLLKVKDEVDFEIIAIDNGSTDGSVEMLKDFESKHDFVNVILNKENIGFAAGNNKAKSSVKGKYVLFLNSDTLIKEKTLQETVDYMEEHADVGALTCKTVLPTGSLDKDARRSFPTPWVAITHFSGLDRLFPKSRLFSKYWYGYISPDTEHEVEVLQGAFFLTRKEILDDVGWFSEDYFLDGEDIDLSWKIKAKGWKIIYYPKVSIIHLKKATKSRVKRVFATTGVDSMSIFYKKYMFDRYPLFLNWLVIFGIKVMKVLRNTKRIFL